MSEMEVIDRKPMRLFLIEQLKQSAAKHEEVDVFMLKLMNVLRSFDLGSYSMKILTMDAPAVSPAYQQRAVFRIQHGVLRQLPEGEWTGPTVNLPTVTCRRVEVKLQHLLIGVGEGLTIDFAAANAWHVFLNKNNKQQLYDFFTHCKDAELISLWCFEPHEA